MGKDPSLMLAGAAPYAHLPAGHQESWADAFRNVIADCYEWVRTGTQSDLVCTFADAHRHCCVIEAMLRSADAGGVWQDVNVGNAPNEAFAPVTSSLEAEVQR